MRSYAVSINIYIGGGVKADTRVVLLVWRDVGCGGWRGSPRASAIAWGAKGGTMEGL